LGYNYKLSHHAAAFLTLAEKPLKATPDIEIGHELLACSHVCSIVAEVEKKITNQAHVYAASDMNGVSYTSFKKAAEGFETHPLQLAFHNNERVFATRL